MSLFPPPSSRTPSRSPSPSRPDSLIAHPLLASPSTASSPTSNTTTTNVNAPASTPPKYVTYTPRGHRGATTAITTSATTSTPASSVGQQNGKNIQRKLQITNLQSAAQGLGLDVSSIGWAILEWLVVPASGSNIEQKEIWETVSTGKATLLLPLEQQSTHIVITAEFVKDHILLVSDDQAHGVTLSGLRGHLQDTQFTIVSSLSPSHPAFAAILSPDTRADGFASLPPLPLIHTDADADAHAPTPPSYKLPTTTDSLPLPSPNPPALPPRPALGGTSSAPPSSGGHSRLSTLASLFGGRGHPPSTQAAQSQPGADPLGGIQTTTTTTTTTTTATPAPTPVALPISHVPAFTTTHPISRAYVGAKLEQYIKHSISCAYTTATLGIDKEDVDWLCGITFELASPLLPLLKVKSGSPARRISRRVRQESSASSIASFSSSEVWSVPFYDFDCQLDGNGKSSLVDTIQDGYLAIEKGFRERFEKKHNPSNEENEKHSKLDDAVGNVMTVAEAVITGLLYDRLYGGTEDTAHDVALRERADALFASSMGLKELGLIVKHIVDSHDGPDVEENSESAIEVVDGIVEQCAQVLSRLDGDEARSPAAKAHLLVEAHRVFVTGFSSSNTHGVWVEAQEEPKHNPSDPTAELELVASPAPEKKKTIISSPPPLSSDLLLPLLIYTIIRYPSICTRHLLSNLLFVQRFRCEDATGPEGSKTGRGEEAYCLVNLVAGVEYVVSLPSTEDTSGQTPSDGVPIPGTKTPPSPIAIFHQSPSSASTKSLPSNSTANTPSSTIFGTSLPSELNISSLRDIDMGAALRGKVDVLTGSANKVISGMVGSSFGILKSLTLPSNAADTVGDTRSDAAPANATAADAAGVVDGEKVAPERPGALGILTGRTPSAGSGLSSIRSMLPSRLGSAAPPSGTEEGRPMLVVSGSRPGSLRAPQSDVEEYTDEESEEEDEDGESEDEEGSDEGEEDDNDENELERPYEPDTRSIRSFESMMRSSAGKAKKRGKKKSRKSLTDRLADVSGLSALRGSPRNSLLVSSQTVTSPISTMSSLQAPHPQLSIAPPIERFMTCDPLDLKIGEIDSLLLDYRRLVREIRAANGFSGDSASTAA